MIGHVLSVVSLVDHSKIQPNSIIARVGDTVNFTCISRRGAKWSFYNEWKNTLEILPTNAIVYQNTLILRHIVLDNEGTYECQGLTGERNIWSGRESKFAARANLAFQSK